MMAKSTKEFIVPNADKVKTVDEARQIAIAWQYWYGEHSISYGEAVYYQNYFLSLCERWPELTDEFSENGVI